MSHHTVYLNYDIDCSIMDFIGRAKRAPHWGVQSRFRVIYIIIAYYTSKSGIWLVISRVASYFHEPKASANTAYE